MTRNLLGLRATLILAFILAGLVACNPETSNAPAGTNDAPPIQTEAATIPAATMPAATEPATSAPATEVPATDLPPTVTTEPAAAEGLCPEVSRPAVGYFIPGGDPGKSTFISNPLARESCYTSLNGDNPGRFQAVPDAVYYTVQQEGQFVVKRMDLDGSSSLLSFTAVPEEDALLQYSFAVSADGSRIAWSAASAGADFSGPEVSRLWLSGIEGNDIVTPLPELQPEGQDRRALVPVRFSADNRTLFYTLQPIGIGGSWVAFSGRYDNLYALPLDTEATPTRVFDCTDTGPLLCLGDFFEVGGQVSALAYVNGQTVVIMNGAGEVLNSIMLTDDYVGYPTFGPAGDLVFYGADLSDDPQASILPVSGTLYRVAPPTAPHEVLASGSGLLYPFDWLDDTHVVVGYSSGGENWGSAVVSLMGELEILQSEPNVSFMDVLPAGLTSSTQ